MIHLTRESHLVYNILFTLLDKTHIYLRDSILLNYIFIKIFLKLTSFTMRNYYFTRTDINTSNIHYIINYIIYTKYQTNSYVINTCNKMQKDNHIFHYSISTEDLQAN